MERSLTTTPALGGERDLEPRESPLSGHRLPILLHQLRCGMLFLKCGPCTAVMQYNSTLYDSVFCPVVCATVFTHIRI